MEKYEGNILLQLKRRLTIDEETKILLKIISDLQVEVGMLTSEKDELQDRIKQKSIVQEIVIENGKSRKSWSKEAVLVDMKRELDVVRKNAGTYKKDLIIWRDRYLSVYSKTGQTLNIDINMKQFEISNQEYKVWVSKVIAHIERLLMINGTEVEIEEDDDDVLYEAPVMKKVYGIILNKDTEHAKPPVQWDLEGGNEEGVLAIYHEGMRYWISVKSTGWITSYNINDLLHPEDLLKILKIVEESKSISI